MKYELRTGVVYETTPDFILLYKLTQRSKIKLFDVAAKIFTDLILNGNDDLFVIHYLQVEFNLSQIRARTKFNKLIYDLLTHKFIIEKYSLQKYQVKEAALEITNGCNFRCPHCYVDKSYTDTLSFSTIKDVAKELLALNCNRILLTGGEIFTHKDFNSIYTYLYKKGFIISLNSNISLLNQDSLNMFKKFPPLSIGISLYGYDDSSYDSYTNTVGQYNKVISNVNELKKLGINVICKNVITNSNKHIFDKIVSKGREISNLFNGDYLAFPKLDKQNKFNPEQLTPQECLDFIATIPNREQYYLELFSNSEISDENVFYCRKNNDAIFITSRGTVCICPCMQTIEYKYTKNNLEACIASLHMLGDMRFSDQNKCKYCSLKALCRYCPAKFYLTTSDYQKAPEWYCELGNLIYNNYIAGLRIIHKSYLTPKEISIFYNFLEKPSQDRIALFVNEYGDCQDYIVVYESGKIIGFGVVKDNSLIQLSTTKENTLDVKKILLEAISEYIP